MAMPPGHKYFSVQQEQRTLLLVLMASFSRSGLEDNYPFLIQSLKSCVELLVSACSLGMFFLYSLLFNKDLVMLTVRHWCPSLGS